MLPFLRIAVLVSICFVALGALGKSTSIAALASLGDSAAQTCVEPLEVRALQNAVDAVDYMGAVLIANGEMYGGQSTDALYQQVAALPAYDPSDGITDAENAALEQLFRLGRQLSYAQAEQELGRLLNAASSGVRIASADDEITYEILEALRGGC